MNTRFLFIKWYNTDVRRRQENLVFMNLKFMWYNLKYIDVLFEVHYLFIFLLNIISSTFLYLSQVKFRLCVYIKKKIFDLFLPSWFSSWWCCCPFHSGICNPLWGLLLLLGSFYRVEAFCSFHSTSLLLHSAAGIHFTQRHQ